MKKLVLILLSISFFACDKKKNTVAPPDLGSITTCFNQTNWNVQSLNSSILGSWQMNKAYNPWVGDVATENVKLKIMSDSNLMVYKNGALLLTCKYHLDSTGNNYYSFVTDSMNQYTPGKLMCCTNQIVFNSSSWDGMDYYYIKVAQ